MLIHPNIDPVALDLGIVQIHWYGIMYLLGFLGTYIICKKRAAQVKAPFIANQVDDIIFYGALGVIIGARVGYVLFYGLEYVLADPMYLFKVWQGGMSFHGGMLGVFISLSWYCKKQAIPVGALLDVIVQAAPIGLFFGRMGNFIGQELWGRVTDVPWGMLFQRDPSGLVRHPSQLYQAFGEGLLLFIIIYWFSSKPRPRWAGSALFVMMYGVFRFIAEFFREPDAQIGFDLFGWLSRGQLLSLPMMLAGLAVFIWAYRNNQVTDFAIIQKAQSAKEKATTQAKRK